MTSFPDAPVAGRQQPARSSDTAFFWEALDEGRLTAQRCSSCSALRHPPGPACPRCHSLAWEVAELSGRGTVYSFIVQHHPLPPGFTQPAVVGLIELEEGLRMVSNILAAPEAITIGDPVEVVFVEQDEGWTTPDVDVVVVGSGIAGLCAALAARESGAESVLIAEAADVIGGASRLSTGLVVAADSSLQRAAGIEDTADLMYRDYMNVNQWGLDAGSLRRLADESGPALDWLISLGVEFHPTPVFGGYESRPRCAVAIGEGQGLIDGLARAARRQDIDVALGQRVDRLLTEDGAIVGIASEDVEITAGSVILASGGFGSDPGKVREHYPSVAAAGDWLWYVGEDGAHGDALDFAGQIGARIRGFDTGCSMLTPGFTRSHETYLPGWLVIVDRDGRRFIPENAHYSALDRQAVLRGGPFTVLFDSQAVDEEIAAKTPFYSGGTKAYPGRAARTSPNWNAQILREMIAAGRIPSAGTIGALADVIGLPREQVEVTVDQYNDGARAGVDRMAKPAEFLRPLTAPPFFAAEIRLSEIVITGAGIDVDVDARVLDARGVPIPGAFAVGEAAWNPLWPFYPSSGSSLGAGMTFGRIAGTSAATAA
jgi:succinate dehydrogenase/fumarate reductase flavoprotein subunit/uncharacterized OB-fold protein